MLTVDCFAEEREIHEEMGLSLITNACLFGACNTARPRESERKSWWLRYEVACDRLSADGLTLRPRSYSVYRHGVGLEAAIASYHI